MFIVFGGVFGLLVLMFYIVVYAFIGAAYLLFGVCVAIAFVALGVWGLSLALLLGCTRWIRSKQVSEFKRGMSDGWLLGIGQRNKMSKAASSIKATPGPRDWTPKSR